MLLIATESNTDMPNQIKERLGHTMIHLKPLTKNKIERYLAFVLKQQPSVHVDCIHARISQEKPSNDAIKGEKYWLVSTCVPCYTNMLQKCIVAFNELPDTSYSMLERFMDQATRASTACTFNECVPHTFRLNTLLMAVTTGSRKNPEYTILKMDKEYESEQERLHKKQLEKQKRLHVEQRGLSLLQSHYTYNQAMQQLVFNARIDNGGMPTSVEKDPKDFLDKEQYRLYENTFTKNLPNPTPLLPSALNSKESNWSMQTTLKDIYYDNNTK